MKVRKNVDMCTPTSRYRTSRHSAPKSFMRFKASSRRFPEFSQPLVTSGRGMSLLMNHESENLNANALASRSPLYTIDPRPWRHQRQYTSHDIYQHIRCVILIFPRPPELVQPSTADDQCGIYFQPIAPERRGFEIFFKLLE